MLTTSQPVHSASMRRHRFHLLDGMRGVAAILIVLYHVPPVWRTHLPLRQAWLAVDFFFLLSGFVIALSYQSRLAEGLRFRDFAVARIIRLYPLYLAGTALGLASIVVVGVLSAHVKLSSSDILISLIPALFFLPNFPDHWPQPYCFPFDVPAWSLILELAANFVFAALLRNRLGRMSVFALVAAASLLVLVVAAIHGLPSLDFGGSLSELPLGLARVGFSFFAGVLVFRLYDTHNTKHSILQQNVFPVVAGLGLLFVLFASSSFTATVAYQIFIVTLVFPVLLYLGACSHLPSAADRACAFLGDVSYPLYVLHGAFVFPLGGSQPRHFLSLHTGAGPWLILPLLVVLVAISYFAARYPDRAIRLRLSRLYNAAAPATA